MATQIHGTCVELAGTGVLLRGPSGSGKSDLALRLIDGGATLVADDRVTIEAGPDGLIARPAEALTGLVEVRGLGIARLSNVDRVRVDLVVDLAPAEEIERLPAAESCDILGVELPAIRLDPFAASADAKVRLAVKAVTHDILVR